MCISSRLSHEHQAIIKAIFSVPHRSDIPWSDVLRVLSASGATVQIYNDRVCLVISSKQKTRPRVGILHRPSGQTYLSSIAIASIQDLLKTLGVHPGDR